MYFDCFESDTYYEWLPVIYDKEAGTVTVLHEYAYRNRNYVLEINRATSGDEGSFVFDIAILLYGNVETQVIENVDLTGAGQFDGNSVTFTVNVDNVTEFNSRYVAEFRIRSDDPGYADYSYLAAYADFSYNSSR